MFSLALRRDRTCAGGSLSIQDSCEVGLRQAEYAHKLRHLLNAYFARTPSCEAVRRPPIAIKLGKSKLVVSVVLEGDGFETKWPEPALISGKFGNRTSKGGTKVAEKNCILRPYREHLRPPAKFSRTKTSAKSAGILSPRRLGSTAPQFGWRRERNWVRTFSAQKNVAESNPAWGARIGPAKA